MASADVLKSGFLLAAAFAIVALFRVGRIGRVVAAAGLLLATAGDLWSLDRHIMDPQIGSAAEYHEYFAESPEVTFLRADSTLFRVLPNQWNDARLASYGVASVLGYHPAKPRLYQAFMDTVGLNTLPSLQMLNIKYVLSDNYFPPELKGLTLRQDGAVKVYEVAGAFPRAYVVHRLRPVRDGSTALAILRSAGIDAREEAIWEAPGALPPLAPPTIPDSVRVLSFDFNKVEYSVTTNAPGVLVTVDEWDPDWSATVDGKPAPIERVNYLMRGVALGAGAHVVRFTYLPRALAAGMRISAASLVATVLLAAVGVVAGRRRGAPSPAPTSPPAPKPASSSAAPPAPAPPRRAKGRRR
jgi:hypothetical protein